MINTKKQPVRQEPLHDERGRKYSPSKRLRVRHKRSDSAMSLKTWAKAYAPESLCSDWFALKARLEKS